MYLFKTQSRQNVDNCPGVRTTSSAKTTNSAKTFIWDCQPRRVYEL